MDAPVCPRCRHPLFEGRRDDAKLLGCGGCGGVWLDNAACQATLAGSAQDLVALAEIAGKVATEAVDVEAAGLLCPACGQALARVQAPGVAIALDVCPAHGTWFDANELRLVALAHADLPPPLRFSPDEYVEPNPYPWWLSAERVYRPLRGRWEWQLKDPDEDRGANLDSLVDLLQAVFSRRAGS